MSGPVYSGGDSSNPASVWYRAGIDRLNRGVRNRSRDPPSKTRSRSSGERPSGGWDRSCFGVDYSPPTLGEGPSRPPVRQLLAPSEGSEQKGRFGWKRSSSQPERTVRAKHNLRNPEPIASLSLARRQSSVDDNHFAPIYSGGLDPPVRKLSSDFNSKRLSIQPHQLQGDRNPSGPISPIQQFYRDNYPPRTTSQSGSSEPHSEHRQLAQSTSEPIYTAPTTYNPPPSAFVAQPNNLQRHLLQPLPANGTPPKPISTVSLDSIDHAAARAFKRNAGGGASMMEQERGRTRRERTFVGSVCSVCDEPLEHTLRGERILQFSCGHVSHEACFYEYIREFESQFCPVCNAPLGLDTSRGGNVLDIEKLSNIVRSVSINENGHSGPTEQNLQQPQQAQQQEQPQQQQQQQPPHSYPASPQNVQNGHHQSGHSSNDRQHPSNRIGWNSDSEDERPRSRDRQGVSSNRRNQDARERDREEQMDNPRRQPSNHHHHHHHQHQRGGSQGSGEFQEMHRSDGEGKKHEYDRRSIESDLSESKEYLRNPIPPPNITVRSEYPTMYRARTQQALTCLITVEVPEGKWRPRRIGSQRERNEDAQPGTKPVAEAPEPSSTEDHTPSRQPSYTYGEAPEVLEEITEDLRIRVENWHGLDFQRFGKLRFWGVVKVGKDRQSWQELECYLFGEMLICVKEKKGGPVPSWTDGTPKRKSTKCTLKGSILIKKHLKNVGESANLEENVLTLSLSVAELPQFHLLFQNRDEMEIWKRALLDLNPSEAPILSPAPSSGYGESEDEGLETGKPTRRISSNQSSWEATKSNMTAPTEYSNMNASSHTLPIASHVPLDVVVVIPVSSSMQGLKIHVLKDALRFLVQNLGDRDRMGLVTFGSSGGGVPLVGMTNKAWPGWQQVLSSIRPVGQKSLRADVVEGANVAMDLLMQRKSHNPLASILLISDAASTDGESVDFVISRAEAAKVTIHSFGLGLTHKPDMMIELSSRTKASYTYVKDWMMLRECVAGCLGSLQTLSHQNVKLKLKLPEGSPARFVKISGALQITKRASGKDAEGNLGDLRFGDRRDILVQLVIQPDSASREQLPQDPWESIVSGLEALGGPIDQDEPRPMSIEEVPLIQADITYGDIQREGILSHLARPSLLAITMLPQQPKNSTRSISRPPSPPIPPHPSIVQRRMELLTSDMLSRALTLVSKGQHERAHNLLRETRSIMQGLGKGGLPPVPPVPNMPGAPAATPKSPTIREPIPAFKKETTPPLANGVNGTDANGQAPLAPVLSAPNSPALQPASSTEADSTSSSPGPPAHNLPPSAPTPPAATADAQKTVVASAASFGLAAEAAGAVDPIISQSLDAELESALEWINHPAVFGRDSRKAVLQAIGVISCQHGYTFRTMMESLWASRIAGVRDMAKRSREWRESGMDESLAEEA